MADNTVKEETTAIPRWSEVTADPRWNEATTKQKNSTRRKWLRDVYKAEGKISMRDQVELERMVYSDEPPQQLAPPDYETIAQTPQVEENPPQFDVTLNQLANMPPGTTVEGAALDPNRAMQQEEQPFKSQFGMAPRAVGSMIKKMPGFGMARAIAEDPKGNAFKTALKGLYYDLIEAPAEAIKASGIPQTAVLGGQGMTPVRAKESKDIPVPKDPFEAIGYFAGRFFSPEKAFKALKKVVIDGGDNVTINDVYKEATGKTMQQEFGKIKGTLIDILGTTASDPALGLDAYFAMTRSATSLKEVLRVAEEMTKDEMVALAIKKNPKLAKGFNLLQNAVSESKLGNKTGKITEAKTARRQPAGKQPAGMLPSVTKTATDQTEKGFQIVRKALPKEKKQITKGKGLLELPSAGGGRPVTPLGPGKQTPIPATAGRQSAAALGEAQKALPAGQKAITAGVKAQTPEKAAEEFGLKIKSKTEMGTWIDNTTNKYIGDIPPKSTRLMTEDVTRDALINKFKIGAAKTPIQQATRKSKNLTQWYNAAQDKINNSTRLTDIQKRKQFIALTREYNRRADVIQRNIPAGTLEKLSSKQLDDMARRMTPERAARESRRIMLTSQSTGTGGLIPPTRTADERKRTADLIKELGGHISDIFNIPGKLGGKFAVDPTLNVANRAKAQKRLNEISSELFRRFKESGKKQYKDFTTFLQREHNLSGEQAAIVARNIAKGAGTRKEVPVEIAARLGGAKTGAERVEKLYNMSREASSEKRLAKVKNFWERTKVAWTDQSSNVKKALLKSSGNHGKRAVMHFDLSKGAYPKANQKIGNALKEIDNGLSKNEMQILDNMIAADREVTISKYRPDYIHEGGLPPQDFENYLKSLPKEISEDLGQRMKIYHKAMKDELTEAYKEGLISKFDYENMASKGNYSPKEVIDYIDPDVTYSFGGKKITVTSSGFEKLGQGSYKLLEKDHRLLLSEVIMRNQSRIMKNRANKALYLTASDIPENGVVKIMPKGMKKVPHGWQKITARSEGKNLEMLMPDKFAEEWVKADPLIKASWANTLGWITGTKFLKPMATGLNPEFALTNFPRDLAHIWLRTSEYSSFAPKYTLQMARDLAATAKDAFFRKGALIDFTNEGGMMDFMSHQGRIFQKIPGIKELEKWGGYWGETSEIWTRLALRNRALRNGKSASEATWIARNYLDFAQGGNMAKALDQAIPYLNANIQGTKGLVNSFREKPLESIWKTTQIASLAAGVYMYNRSNNKEALDSVRPRDKVNNFIFTTNRSYTDANGEKRYLYFKIAKDQGQRIISTLFENLMARFMGDEVNPDELKMGLKDSIVLISNQNLPPVLSFALGYASNYDFWANENIWKGGEVPASKEYTKYTPLAFKQWGELTGMSPERTKYGLQKYFTYGNIWTDIAGGTYNKLFDGMSDKQKEKIFEDEMRKYPFIRRIMKATDPYAKYEKEIKQKKSEAAGRAYDQRFKLDELAADYYDKRTMKSKADMRNYINTQPPQDRKKLMARVEFYGKVHHLRDKKWWMELMTADPETRALLYYSRYKIADNEEKKRLNAQLRKLPRIRSARFARELRKLKTG